MSRIDTNQYYTLEESAEFLNRNVFTVRQWVKEHMFDIKDVMVFEGQTLIKKTAVRDLYKVISD